jgi:hypothetical protein
MSYLMKESTREQMAAEDPFSGSGTFLPFPGLSDEEISGALAAKGLGAVPSFAWDGIGVWVEVSGARDA